LCRPSGESLPPPHSGGSDRPVAERWRRRPRLRPGSSAWSYLAEKRQLPASILKAAAAADIVRDGPFASAWFAHRHTDGAVSHVEIRGPDYKGSLKGGTKTLFRFGRAGQGTRRLAVAEAPIEALSLAAIEGVCPDTVYAATGGGIGPGTVSALQDAIGLINLAPRARLVMATDANRAGDRYAARLAEIATAAGIPVERLRPIGQTRQGGVMPTDGLGPTRTWRSGYRGPTDGPDIQRGTCRFPLPSTCCGCWPFASTCLPMVRLLAERRELLHGATEAPMDGWDPIAPLKPHLAPVSQLSSPGWRQPSTTARRELLPFVRDLQVLQGFDGAGTSRLRAPKRPVTVRHLSPTPRAIANIFNANLGGYVHLTGLSGTVTCRKRRITKHQAEAGHLRRHCGRAPRFVSLAPAGRSAFWGSTRVPYRLTQGYLRSSRRYLCRRWHRRSARR